MPMAGREGSKSAEADFVDELLYDDEAVKKGIK